MVIINRLSNLVKEVQKVAERSKNLKQEDKVNYINQLLAISQGIKTFMRRIWIPRHVKAHKLLINDYHMIIT